MGKPISHYITQWDPETGLEGTDYAYMACGREMTDNMLGTRYRQAVTCKQCLRVLKSSQAQKESE